MTAAKKPPESEQTTELMKELEALLEELGIRLTADRRVEGRGGYCLVHGEQRLIVNSRLPASEKVELILEELSRLDLGEVFIAPALRERIEEVARAEAREAEPNALSPSPGASPETG